MDIADARLTVGVPNDLQMERNLTGGIPRPVDKTRSIPRTYDTRSRKEAKWGAGEHRSTGLQNGERGKCSDARDEHVCKCNAHDDMI